jgi:hypothetical protein
MAANAIPTSELKIDAEKTADSSERSASEGCARVPLKQRVAKVLRELFEGHEEYLGATPD